MKTLHVFSFNQHWFHLGSMVENILDRKKDFEKIEINLFQQNLKILPVDMHFRFPLSKYFKNSPEKIALEYLRFHSDIGSNIINLKKQKILFNQIPENIDELKALRVDNLQIGMAIASHLISLTKDSQPNTQASRHQMIRCFQFYFDIKAWFLLQAYSSVKDEIWVCNGRTFHERVIVELASQNGIKVSFYEIGGEGQVPNRWILHDVSPHDRNLHQIEIMKHSRLNEPDMMEIEKWFLVHEDPKKNQFASKSIDSRKINEISRKPFVVYFSSSDDEVAAISSEWNSPWGNQIAAVRGAIETFSEQSKYNLVIRVHPNQGNKSKRDRRVWDQISPKDNCFIFKYSEAVNSYELMRKSAAVLTHGSTMGVEAAFRSKKQAFLSPTRFDQLIPAPLLKDKNSLKRWLDALDLSSSSPNERERKGAIMWANYMLTAGFVWKNVNLRTKSGRQIGFLNEKSLRPRVFFIAITRVYVWIYRTLFEKRTIHSFLSGVK